MANANEFKVTTQELIAVANGIRVLLGQPLSTDQNYNAATDSYQWSSDYTTKLSLIESTLNSLSSVIGNTGSDGDGVIEELQNKIDDVQDKINELLDPDNSERDVTIHDGIEDLEDIFGDLDDIVDGDDSASTGRSPAELVSDIEDGKEALEAVINPTDQNPYSFNEVVDEIEEQIDALRDIDKDPEDDIPDERSLAEVVEEIGDKIDRKNELEDLIERIEEIIHDAAIITGDEDPGQSESEEISRENISELADEVLDLMDQEELEWDDLSDDAKIVLIIDDLLDIIEETTEALDEYRNGDFQIIETFSEATGSGIFRMIQNLETARRDNMTEQQKQDEAIVIYVSRCLFNTTESFICTGFIDGERKNGAFFYTDNQNSNFYNISAPTSNARLGAGKYLIRIVLRQEAYFNAEV